MKTKDAASDKRIKADRNCKILVGLLSSVLMDNLLKIIRIITTVTIPRKIYAAIITFSLRSIVKIITFSVGLFNLGARGNLRM